MAEQHIEKHPADSALDDTNVHNTTADKIMILACATIAGTVLCTVAAAVLHYAWFIALLYFIGMFAWVVLFFEYFNYSLFRK